MHRVLSCRSAAARRATMAILLILLLTALGAVAAGPAAAAPPASDHPMSLDDLRALIVAHPDGVPGYFKTVLKGKDIVEIPCTITAVVDGLLWDNTALIMFEATGPDIDRIGGIAAGMSGSPLFVDDTIDSLIGAVSYGDSFTTNGLGLATPIEYMSAIEEDHMSTSGVLAQVSSRLNTAPNAHALVDPVKTSGGTSIERIVIARTIKQAGTIKADPGTAVMAPLFTVGIGGLSANSAAYKNLAAKLEARGLNVRSAGSTGVYDTFETPLVGGAAVGAVIGYGDYWIGGMGTVTYAHDTVVAAFGHPFFGDGDTSLILTNAWVHGVWSSLYDPYKIMTLGKIRGEVTQDRSHGIVGIVGDPPAMIDMKSTATLPSPGPTASAETLVPRDMPGIDWIAGEIAWGNGAMPVDKLLDGAPSNVSADTHLKIVVSDVPHTVDLTLDRDNMVDGTWGLGDEAWMALDKLLSNPNGTAPAKLISVDMTTNLMFETRMATLLDIEVPGGLHRGDNTVIATVRPYGQIATETREATLNIPAGAPLRGWVEAVGGTYWNGWYWSDSSSSCFTTGRTSQRAAGSGTRTIKPPPTLGDLMATVEGWPQDNDLVVTYSPNDSSDVSWDADGDGSAEARAHTPQVLYGYVDKSTSRVLVRPIPSVVARGGRVMLQGFIEASSRGDAGTVQIYKVVPGATPDILLATVPVMKTDRMLQFSYRTPKVRRATTFLAVWSGNDRYLGATGTCKVRVR